MISLLVLTSRTVIWFAVILLRWSYCGDLTTVSINFNSQGAAYSPTMTEAHGERAITFTGHYLQWFQSNRAVAAN